jgi:flagellar basal body-associated protein FliL
MGNDFEEMKNDSIQDATSLDSLFDAPVEGFEDGKAPSEFFYTVEEEVPDASGIDFGEEDAEPIDFEEVEEEEPKKKAPKKKKEKAPKGEKPKKKKTGLIIVAVLLVLALAAAAYFYFFGGKKFNVTFVSDGGAEIQTVKVREGSTVPLIEAPAKEGYVFVEWQLNGKKYDESSLVGSDLTLTAFYKKAMKVTFLNEDKSEFLVVEVAEGETVEKPEKDPEVKNKAFVTWMTEDNKVFSFSTPITKDITLIAKMKDYIKPTGLAYANPEYRIYVNEEKNLPAVVTPGNTTETVMYESSDPTIFTVDNKGMVKGRKEGTATLTAKVEGLVATTTIVVQEKPVVGISIQEGAEVRIGKGKTMALHAVIDPDDATHKEVTWTSSDNTIATVDKNGVLKGVKKGKCVVTVTAHNGVSYNTQVEVYVPVERVELSYSGSSLYMYYGSGSLTVTATIYPSDADVQTVEWSLPPNAGERAMFNLSSSGNTIVVSAGEGSIYSGAAYHISASADGVTCSNPIDVYAEPLIAVQYPYDDTAFTANVGEEFTLAFNMEGTISVSNGDIFSVCNIGTSSVTMNAASAGETSVSITTNAGQTKYVTISFQ